MPDRRSHTTPGSRRYPWSVTSRYSAPSLCFASVPEGLHPSQCRCAATSCCGGEGSTGHRRAAMHCCCPEEIQDFPWCSRYCRYKAACGPRTGKHTKVVVAKEHGQLHGLQRRVQLRQPVVSQLGGGQEVLRLSGSRFREHGSRPQEGSSARVRLPGSGAAMHAGHWYSKIASVQRTWYLYELCLPQLGWVCGPHRGAGS
jgi:hypothetical protein